MDAAEITRLLLGILLTAVGGGIGWKLAEKYVTTRLNIEFGNSLKRANLYKAYLEYFEKERERRNKWN